MVPGVSGEPGVLALSPVGEGRGHVLALVPTPAQLMGARTAPVP